MGQKAKNRQPAATAPRAHASFPCIKYVPDAMSEGLGPPTMNIAKSGQ
jgi:hypothetical protein